MTHEELLEVALAEFHRHPKATWDQQRGAMAAVVQAIRWRQWNEFKDLYDIGYYDDETYDLAEELFKP